MNKINKIKTLIDNKLWTDDPNIINPYLYEQRGTLKGNSSLLFKPINTSNVSEILKLCNKYKVPVIPQGGRTGLCGGTVPNNKGNEVLLSTEKMNKITKIESDKRIKNNTYLNKNR